MKRLIFLSFFGIATLSHASNKLNFALNLMLDNMTNQSLTMAVVTSSIYANNNLSVYDNNEVNLSQKSSDAGRDLLLVHHVNNDHPMDGESVGCIGLIIGTNPQNSSYIPVMILHNGDNFTLQGSDTNQISSPSTYHQPQKFPITSFDPTPDLTQYTLYEACHSIDYGSDWLPSITGSPRGMPVDTPPASIGNLPGASAWTADAPDDDDFTHQLIALSYKDKANTSNNNYGYEMAVYFEHEAGEDACTNPAPGIDDPCPMIYLRLQLYCANPDGQGPPDACPVPTNL
ncbi:MAG: hypothetical protein EBX40_03210 [Gammaproteobacteria bacterium]|nr:hypothetical protein [Gammaproteobacteria bacterium]